ncbi:acetyltransferase [Baekduia alba]|uniref:GNAT family N-acetyltransferase n=1 Tax=Baekduia alba TaxID=2997333 RepID=UPI0023406F1F|nr:GNAT family N-acetyltransferase [Baekduia alba]WCB94221.1 acetyltransferase [Baekduia alba]
MIRPVADGDARAIAELEVRAWRWAYVDVVPEEQMITVDARVARWQGRSAEGAYVAEVEGRVVGVVQVGPDGDDPEAGLLRGLNVEPAAQGAGVGAALYEHAVAALRTAGFATGVLWVFAANGHARGFYERRGWTPDGATGVAADAPELRYRKNLGT